MGTHRVAWSAVWVAAVLNVAAVALLLASGLTSDGPILDQLRPVPISALYLLPAVLAVLATRRRVPLLLPAGVAALALSVFPFSLHSFVLAPGGIAYLLVYGRLPARADVTRVSVAAVLCPMLAVGALAALVWHEDPVCYEETSSGDVRIDRDPDRGRLSPGTQTIGPGSDIVSTGCTGDTVVWWEAMSSVALSVGAVGTALIFVRRDEDPEGIG